MQAIVNEPVMHIYLICAAVLVLKMMFVTATTGITRIKTKSYVTPEDDVYMGQNEPVPNAFVERMRRIHRNDLETVLPFLAIGFLWALTGPSYTLALWLFTLFTVARVAHTACYTFSWQPWRTIVFLINEVILWLIPILLLIAIL